MASEPKRPDDRTTSFRCARRGRGKAAQAKKMNGSKPAGFGPTGMATGEKKKMPALLIFLGCWRFWWLTNFWWGEIRSPDEAQRNHGC